MNWFGVRSANVRCEALELRVAALESKISSASEILEATERMDRILKRSFRLNKQLAMLEGEKEAAPAPGASAALSRADLIRMRG